MSTRPEGDSLCRGIKIHSLGTMVAYAQSMPLFDDLQRTETYGYRPFGRIPSIFLASYCFAAACAPAPQPALANATIPAGFTFSNTRSIAISIDAVPDALLGNAAAPLQIELADGTVLYRGHAHASQPIALNLAVPLRETVLIATLSGTTGANRIQLPLSQGKTSGSFR